MYIGTAIYILQLRYVYRHRTYYIATAIYMYIGTALYIVQLRYVYRHRTKNEIRCRDDPKNCKYTKKPLQGMVESMQQSSATPKNRDVGRGLRKIVACSQPYLAVASCIYSFWHGVIPTAFYTCFTYFSLTVSISTT